MLAESLGEHGARLQGGVTILTPTELGYRPVEQFHGVEDI